MRKLLANLAYAFAAFPLALSALLLLSARPWLLDRDFYRRAVSDDRLYAAIAAAPLPDAESGPGRELVRAGDGSVYDGPALAEALRRNLPSAELKAAGLRAVDQAMDLVEGKDRDGSFDLDLRPLKAAIASRRAPLARDYAAALAVRDEPPLPGDFSYRPASLSPKAAEARAAAALDSQLRAMPDTIARRVDARVSVGRGPRTFLTRALLDRAAASLAALSALLIAGLAALGGGALADRAARAGRYLLPPSIAVLALGVLLSLPGAAFVGQLIPEEARAALSGSAAAALRSYAASLLGVAARGLFLTGLVGTSLGGLLAQARRIAEPREIE